jgi:hypothetical protein
MNGLSSYAIPNALPSMNRVGSGLKQSRIAFAR